MKKTCSLLLLLAVLLSFAACRDGAPTNSQPDTSTPTGQGSMPTMPTMPDMTDGTDATDGAAGEGQSPTGDARDRGRMYGDIIRAE